jgi:serine/threonine protein kinase
LYLPFSQFEAQAMTDAMLHPSDGDLLAFNQGRLQEPALGSISAHLDECTVCCGRLSELSSSDFVLAWLRQIAGQESGCSTTVNYRAVANHPSAVDLDTQFASDATPRPHEEHPTAADRLPRWLGHYEVLAEVGRGGMGVVYKARHRKLQRVAAVKTILAQEHASPEQLLRFHREAELAAQVRHPNVVQVYEVGEHAGRPFIAMEWVEGGTLAGQLKQRPLPPKDAARLVESLARAVHVAHSQGVVHCDLKPANVLLASGVALAPRGTPGADATGLANLIPKITDFGVARPLESVFGLTQTGAILGTPEYMAPEQAGGRRGEVGPAADVYSLGAILYEAVAGQPPFRAETVLETLQQVCSQEPVALSRLRPGVPRDLQTICLKCLEKSPGRRYRSALALADDLRRFLAGQPIHARPVGSLERFVKWSGRHRSLAGLLLLVLLVAVVGFPGVTLLWFDAATARQRAQDREADAVAARKQAQERETDAVKARKETQVERDRFQQQSAELLFERGLKLAEQGEPDTGLHWMLESLKTAPAEAHTWRRMVRVNLAAWAEHVHGLKHIFDVPWANALALSPDGRVLAVATTTGKLWRFDTATGKTLGPASVSSSGVDLLCVAFSPDGKRILARENGPPNEGRTAASRSSGMQSRGHRSASRSLFRVWSSTSNTARTEPSLSLQAVNTGGISASSRYAARMERASASRFGSQSGRLPAGVPMGDS